MSSKIFLLVHAIARIREFDAALNTYDSVLNISTRVLNGDNDGFSEEMDVSKYFKNPTTSMMKKIKDENLELNEMIKIFKDIVRNGLSTEYRSSIHLKDFNKRTFILASRAHVYASACRSSKKVLQGAALNPGLATASGIAGLGTGLLAELYTAGSAYSNLGRKFSELESWANKALIKVNR